MCERLAGGKERVTGKRNGEQKAWTGREEAARTQREKADGGEEDRKSHGRACERLAYGGGGEGYGEEKRRTEGADGVRRSRAYAEGKSRRGRARREKPWTGVREASVRRRRRGLRGRETENRRRGRGAEKPRVRRGKKPTGERRTGKVMDGARRSRACAEGESRQGRNTRTTVDGARKNRAGKKTRSKAQEANRGRRGQHLASVKRRKNKRPRHHYGAEGVS